METPLIKVGIMAEKEIFFTIEGNYLLESSIINITGNCKAKIAGPCVYLECGENSWLIPDSLKLTPVDPEIGKFILHDVTIGINFHWERKEDQKFKGELHFIIDNDTFYTLFIF